MQEKESIMVVRCELKIPSLGVTVRHHSASLVMRRVTLTTEFSIHTEQPLKILILCFSNILINEPPHDKTNKMTVHPAKTQLSLGIHPDWSESSLCAQWVAKDPRFLHADSEDSDQTGRMPHAILLVLSWGGSNNSQWFLYCKLFQLHVLRIHDAIQPLPLFQWQWLNPSHQDLPRRHNFLQKQDGHFHCRASDSSSLSL